MTQQATPFSPEAFNALNVGIAEGIITEADVRFSAHRWTCLPEIDDLQAVLHGEVSFDSPYEPPGKTYPVWRLVYEDLAGKFLDHETAEDAWEADYGSPCYG